MRYYAQYSSDNRLISIGTGNGGTEISEAEYNALLVKIREKAVLVDQLYNGDITIDAVPTDWQDEIQRRVDERREQEAAAGEEQVSGDDLLAMMEGVL